MVFLNLKYCFRIIFKIKNQLPKQPSQEAYKFEHLCIIEIGPQFMY